MIKLATILVVINIVVDLTPGLYYLRQKDYRSALKFFQKALDEDPSYVPTYYYLAQTYLGLGDVKEAEVVTEKGLKIDPASRELLLTKYSILTTEKRLEEALEVAEKLKSLYPSDTLARLALGQAYFNLGGKYYTEGDKRKALAMFKRAVKYLPNNPEVYKNIAIIYYELNEPDSAYAVTKKALEIAPFDLKLLKVHAEILARLKKVDELEETLKTILTIDPEDLQMWLSLARLYRSRGRMDDAIKIYEKLIKEFPDSLSVYREYAGLYEGIFDFKKVREIYGKYLERHPGSREVLKKIAESYEFEEKWDSAIVFYRKLDGDTGVVFRIPVLLVKSGKLKEGEVEARKLLAKFPRLHLTYKILISILDSLYGPDSTLKYAGLMIQNVPEDPYPYEVIGTTSYRLGEIDTARVYLERAIFHGSTNPEVYYYLADMYFKDGKRDRAILVTKIAFRKLTSSISNITESLSGSNILELKKHEGEAVRLKKINMYLKKLLVLLRKHTNDSDYLKFLENLRKRFPESYLVNESLCEYFMEKGDYRKALSFASTLVRQNPRSGRYHYLRGRILEELGRFDEAYLEFKRALIGGERSPEVAESFLDLAKKTGKEELAVSDLVSFASRDSTLKKFLMEKGLIKKE